MKTVQQIEAEAMQQVVATVLGRAVTRGELNEAFKLVQPQGNWKETINATVQLDEAGRAMVREAVIFFTGSVPTFTPVPGLGVQVKAAGYYATIGA